MRISDAVKRVTLRPPWFVRALGAAIIGADVWMWLAEHSPVETLELAKHGILLAVGLACFWPEGLILVANTARRLPFLNRRSVKRND